MTSSATDPYYRTLAAWRDEYFDVSNFCTSLRYILDNSLVDKLRQQELLVCAIDSYDLLNWFFRPGISFYDSHYATVHNLWRTIEQYIERVPNLKVTMLPPSALETVTLFKRSSDIVLSGSTPEMNRIAERLTIERLGIQEFGNLISTLAREYGRAQAMLQEAAQLEGIKRLSVLVDKSIIVPVDHLSPKQNARTPAAKLFEDLVDFDQVVGPLFNTEEARTFIAERRKFQSDQVEDKFNRISVNVDTLNAQCALYANERLGEMRRRLTIVTHGWVTLWGLARGVATSMSRPAFHPFTHSCTIFILVKMISELTYDRVQEHISAAWVAASSYGEALLRGIPNLNTMIRDEKKVAHLLSSEVAMPSDARPIFDYWTQEFREGYLAVETFVTQEQVKKATVQPDLIQVLEWAKRDEERAAQAKKIRQVARSAFGEPGFLGGDVQLLMRPDTVQLYTDALSLLHDRD